jgi:hypothetical protein
MRYWTVSVPFGTKALFRSPAARNIPEDNFSAQYYLFERIALQNLSKITPKACISSVRRTVYHQHAVLYIVIAKGDTAPRADDIQGGVAAVDEIRAEAR